MIEVTCHDEGATRRIAGRLASALRPGDVVVLAGPLGSGKTLFTGGLASGLGVEEPVTSPSFVLVRRYLSGFMPVVHADAYRLSSINEFDDLDVFELARDGVLIIEWGDAVEQVLPEDHLHVGFELRDETTRVLAFDPRGSWVDRDLGLSL